MALIRRSSFAFPRQWNPTQVPNFPVEVDWTHPLANGLVGCFVPSQGYRDLTGNVPFVQPASGSGVPIVTTSSGQAWAQTTGTYGLYATATAPYTTGPAFTVFWAGKTLGAYVGNYDALLIGVTYDTQDDYPYISYGIDFFTDSSIAARVGSSVGSGFTPSAGDFTAACLFRTASYGADLYSNGILQHNSSLSGAPSFSSSSQISIAGYMGGLGRSPNVATRCALFYNNDFGETSGATGNSFMAWLNAEPFAMLRPVVRRLYSVPSGAGSSTASLALSADPATVSANATSGIAAWLSTTCAVTTTTSAATSAIAATLSATAAASLNGTATAAIAASLTTTSAASVAATATNPIIASLAIAAEDASFVSSAALGETAQLALSAAPATVAATATAAIVASAGVAADAASLVSSATTEISATLTDAAVASVESAATSAIAASLSETTDPATLTSTATAANPGTAVLALTTDPVTLQATATAAITAAVGQTTGPAILAGAASTAIAAALGETIPAATVASGSTAAIAASLSQTTAAAALASAATNAEQDSAILVQTTSATMVGTAANAILASLATVTDHAILYSNTVTATEAAGSGPYRTVRDTIEAFWADNWGDPEVPVYWRENDAEVLPDPSDTPYFIRNQIIFGHERVRAWGGGGRNAERLKVGALLVRVFAARALQTDDTMLDLLSAAEAMFRAGSVNEISFVGDLSAFDDSDEVIPRPEAGNWYMRGSQISFQYRFTG